VTVTAARDADPVNGSGFRHEALFYSGDAEFLAGTVPFVLEGVDRGESVLVVVSEPRLVSLRTALGPATAHVTFADMKLIGVNPARIIPVWLDFVDRFGSGGRAVRGVGEPIWAGRTDEEIVECQIHESLLNVAFAGPAAVTILCPYDAAALEHAVCDEAHHSHPWLRHAGVCSESTTFGESPANASPLSPVPRRAHREVFGADDVRRIRRLVAGVAAQAGLAADRAADLVLAVSEIAANSTRHGGGSGTFRAWITGESVICEVRDRGRIEHPLAGRLRPKPDQPGGRGLWLANQLCDLVQIRVTARGSTVRLHQHAA
jgi:anti-sigma regulatory factor (Ser/Thr protein kinase)